MSAPSGFVHIHVPPSRPGAPTLLLLHGTGGDENDLLPLGRALDPGAGLLSLRGKVLEHGMPRFFRRIAEGVFDLEDLRVRTAELAAFIPEAAAAYGFDRERLIAVGYSNGANIALSLLLSPAPALGGAVLLRAMAPYEPDPVPGRPLAGTRVLIREGRTDPYIPVEQGTRVADLVRSRGADVTLQILEGGHGLEREDLDAARAWLTGAVS